MLGMMKCSIFEPVVVSSDPRNQRGFTLVEMMVVVAMIALILGVSLPNLWRSSVRAEMLSQVAMIQQAVGVARIYAIKNSSQVALQLLPDDDAPIAKYSVHAWVDSDGDGALGATEEVVGRWPMTGDITINSETGNSSHTLHPLAGTALGVVFFANGTAMVHDNQIGTGQGAVVLQDTYENKLRITIQGGSGSVLTDMWNYEEEEWIDNPKSLWRY
jgi:prepilin-type N-terminal cleavage/methylation domain-containing protein